MLSLTPEHKFQLLWYAVRLKHPKCAGVSVRLPLAMARLEAKPGFTSNLAVTANNLFGMKYPEGRVNAGTSTAVGKTTSGFAIFRSMMACIDDFFYWLENWKLFSDAELDDFVKAGRYTPDKGYYETVHKIADQLAPGLINPGQLVATGALSVVGLGLAVHIVKKVSK